MSANEPSTEKQRLLNALFDDPKREHVNIKFFRGMIGNAIPVETFCAQITAALEQLDNKMLQPTAGIEESFPTVNIKELVVSA
jgi:hypothetical protein